jgi:lambda repressor-like predicted transcriptional regulator
MTAPRDPMTAGQRRRRRRNLEIARARKAGASLRALAVATGLSAARIAAILDDLEHEAAEKSERIRISASRPRFRC